MPEQKRAVWSAGRAALSTYLCLFLLGCHEKKCLALVKEPLTITIHPDGELGCALDATDRSAVLLERGGARCRKYARAAGVAQGTNMTGVSCRT